MRHNTHIHGQFSVSNQLIGMFSGDTLPSREKELMLKMFFEPQTFNGIRISVKDSSSNSHLTKE